MENKKEQILDARIPDSILETSTSIFAKNLAIMTFIIGSIFFLLDIVGLIEIFPDKPDFISIRLLIINLVIIVNFLVLVYVFFKGKNPQEKSINRNMATKMLFNIPVAILYTLILQN